MATLNACTGAILIGGQSSRFGSPKHELVMPDGRSMVEHVRSALTAVCPTVVTVAAFDAPPAPTPVICDLRPNAGPLGALEALLASGVDEQYVICPCDVPLVTPALLGLLTADTHALASVFQIEGRPHVEPLPARLRAEALPVVRRLLNAQQRSVWKLIQELQPHITTLSEHQAAALLNINSREDFEQAVQQRFIR